MATGTLAVGGKFGLGAVGFKLVAEAAIRAESGSGIGPRLRILVPGMRKIRQDAARWQQVGFVARSGVALSAKQRPRFLVEIILVACAAFGVSGAL